MRAGRGNYLPESEEDYATLLTAGEVLHTKCIYCAGAFSSANVFTHSGWRETQITGFCEECFNEMTKDQSS